MDQHQQNIILWSDSPKHESKPVTPESFGIGLIVILVLSIIIWKLCGE